MRNELKTVRAVFPFDNGFAQEIENKLSLNGAKHLKLPQSEYLITTNRRKVRFLRF